MKEDKSACQKFRCHKVHNLYNKLLQRQHDAVNAKEYTQDLNRLGEKLQAVKKEAEARIGVMKK